MPNYLFYNRKTKVTKEFFFHMDDAKNPGPDWERIFLTSGIGVDGKISDPFSRREFVAKTRNKRMRVGEYWEESQIQSDRRAAKAGFDPVLKTYTDNWSKKRRNKTEHPIIKKQKIKEELSKKGVVLED